MIQQAYTRTDLDKQEAMIDEWKRQKGWTDNLPVTRAKTPDKGNAFLFASTEAEKQASEKRRADYKIQRQAKGILPNAESEALTQQQAEFWKKYHAQKDGNPDPIYYYSLFNNKIKRQTRKHPLPDLSRFAPHTGKYGKLKGSNMGNQILQLLNKHDYIDVDVLVDEHSLNRQAFLSTAKQLEKVGLLNMVKTGIKVAYLERVK